MDQFESELAGYRQVELRWGETLQRLALRELGDAQLWIDIANMNGLSAPFVTDDPAVASEKVALYGDVLWVPAPVPVVSSARSPELIFDQDVKLVNGFLTAEEGDFALAYGLGNLTQALRHRIQTDKSDLLFHSEYGCKVRELVGDKNSGINGLLAAQYVKDALLVDPRVQDVLECTATVTGETVYVDAVIVPIDGRQFQFGGYF